MANLKPTNSDEPEQLPAARQELDVLDKLSQGLSAQIADLSRTPQSLGQIDNTELALIENRYSQLKAYEELAHTCYGRTVIGTEVDETERPKNSFVYRITQANVGFADKNCFVLARNTPLATQLVTAQPGDERDVATRGGDRYLNVSEVRTFEGPVSLRSPSQEPNFRSMAIRMIGSKRAVVVEDLRSFVRRIPAPPEREIELPSRQIDERFTDKDLTWLFSWSGISLADSDEQSLSHQFFTRTTVDQERALNNPRGLTFVEGVAGAGKTSVALGRLKFFSNFATGVEREYYGLQNASEKDFSPVGMVGFVLSHSLKRYLKETASELGLEHLPIRDFEEFRADLSDRFGIASRFRKKKGESSSVRSRINWLRALDVKMAHVAGVRLRENLAQAKDIPKRVVDEVSRIAAELLRSEHQPNSKTFHLSGLAIRIVEAVAEAELREQEEITSQSFQVLEKANNERRRREELALEREMRRIQQQSERKIVSPLGRSLLSGLTSHELFLSALISETFPALAREAFGSAVSVQDLDKAIAEIRSLINDEQGRPALKEADLVALVIFAAMIADGFDYTEQNGSLGYLHQVRRNTAVFIDEVQDFTEIEILLMGMTATNAYHQITLSGDRCQQLHSDGAQTFDSLFPWVPRSRQNGTIFLDQNFRQRPELAALSAGFRSLILEDKRVDFRAEETSGPATVYRYDGQDHLAEFVLKRIRSLSHHATVAVVTATVTEAQSWYDLLNEELGAYHRSALMSRRDDLTKRVNIHFTEVRETKGLEFDVIIVPNLGSFELGCAIGNNQAYVAISRAKHALMIGCAINHADKPKIKCWKKTIWIVYPYIILPSSWPGSARRR